MKQCSSLDQWINLSTAERSIIMQKFNIQKSGGMEVADGQIVSDGVTIKDLMAINVGSMIEFLGDKHMKDILEAFDAGVEHLFDNLWKIVLKDALRREEPKKLEEEKPEAPKEEKSEVKVEEPPKKEEEIFKT